MESHGLPGTIQVTADTRALLLERFEFESRGIVVLKGKGPMAVYLLTGRRAEHGAIDQSAILAQ